MTSTTLYLKYRPQKIDDLDLSSVRETLGKIIKSGQVPHGLLFAGPKGTGKTSAARILAKVVNCEKNEKKLSEPCGRCSQCVSITKGTNMDVIEMDAASNRGIDDIRALKDKIILSPAKAKRKVYIIDEAHMLTTEAFNALLKTLEEPPAHVLFILATTDAHKLPETVISRLSLVPFRKATTEEVKRQLERVVKGEKIARLSDGVINIISDASDGSFRDAVKILEQLLVSVGKRQMKEEDVREIVLSTKSFSIGSILDPMMLGSAGEAMAAIEKFVATGGSLPRAIDMILIRLHSSLLAKNGIGEDSLSVMNQRDLISLIKLLAEARAQTGKSFIPQLPFEIAVAKWCQANSAPMVDTPPPETLEKKEHRPAQVTAVDEIIWKKVLETAKLKNTRVEALLRAAKPIDYDGKTLKLGVYYKFHKERLEVISNRQSLEDIVSAVFGSAVAVACELTQKEKPLVHEKPLAPTTDQDIISAAKEIFGN